MYLSVLGTEYMLAQNRLPATKTGFTVGNNNTVRCVNSLFYLLKTSFSTQLIHIYTYDVS